MRGTSVNTGATHLIDLVMHRGSTTKQRAIPSSSIGGIAIMNTNGNSRMLSQRVTFV